MKYKELLREMSNFNDKHGIQRAVMTKRNSNGYLIHMNAKIVISNKVFANKLPIENRTYEFDNYNKALTSGDGGYSIFAYCKADKDLIRAERLQDEDIETAEIIEIVE